MSQKQIWNNIAKEWSEFKDKPGEGIVKFLEKQKGKVLDLGSGAGRHLMKIKSGEMYLVDFSEEMIKFAKQKAKKEKIKAEFFVTELIKLPFRDNYFDAAIFIAVLHCIEGEENREKVVKELFRVLKPEAKVKVAVWNKNSKKYKNSPKERFVRWRDKGKRYYYLFEEKEIHDLFKKVGFKITYSWKPFRNIVFIAQKI